MLNERFKKILIEHGLKTPKTLEIIEFLNKISIETYKKIITTLGIYEYMIILSKYKSKSMLKRFSETFNYDLNNLMIILKNEENILNYLKEENANQTIYVLLSENKELLKKYFNNLNKEGKTTFLINLLDLINNSKDLNDLKEIVLNIFENTSKLELHTIHYKFIIDIYQKLNLKTSNLPFTKDFFDYLISQDIILSKYLFLYDIRLIEDVLKDNKEFREKFINMFKELTYAKINFKDSKYIFDLLRENNINPDFIFANFSELCFKSLQKDNQDRVEILNYLLESLNLTERELVSKLYKIMNFNGALINENSRVINANNLFNFSLLNKRFEKIDLKWIARIMSDSDLTGNLVLYDNNQINILKQILEKLESINMNTNSLIVSIIKNLNNLEYSNLINDIKDKELTSTLVTNLILVLQDSKNINNINTLDELENIESNLKFNNLEDASLNIFGIGLKIVRNLLREFKDIVKDVPNNEVENEIKNIYFLLSKLLNSNDLNDFLYLKGKVITDTNFDKTKYFNLKLYLESLITKEYVNTLFDSKDKINLEIANVPVVLLDDLKFNMLLHSTNAFFDRNIEGQDIKKLWYLENMREHAICNTYIGNDFIKPANFKSICFGFSKLEDGAFVASYHDDMWSPSHYFDLTVIDKKHSIPNDLIKKTTDNYCEVVIDRLLPNLEKRKPDYVVYFSTISDVDEIQKDELFKNCLKVANDFNIPVVVVDRLKYARMEEENSLKLFELLEINPNLETLDLLMIKLKNNYCSTKDLNYDFFSKDSIVENIMRIYDIVKQNGNELLYNKFIDLLKYFPSDINALEKLNDDLKIGK